MNKQNLIIVTAGILVLGVFTVGYSLFDGTSDGKMTASIESSKSNKRAAGERLIGAAPGKSESAATHAKRSKGDDNRYRLDTEFIFNAMSQIKIDPDGRLVLNGETKQQLETAFTRVSFDLSEDELEELQALIKIGVQGDAGEEAAKIVRDYYDYRIAEHQIISMMNTEDPGALQTNFDQIVQLRIAHLGYDVATALYGEEQKSQQYMIDSINIQNDTSLSDDEKQSRQELLTKNFERSMN